MSTGALMWLAVLTVWNVVLTLWSDLDHDAILRLRDKP